MSYPPKATVVVPPESAIIMQIHYHRNGKPETDKSKIAIWLAKEKPEKYVHYMLVDTKFLWIPKGVSQYKSIGSRVVEQDCEIFMMKPHMHFLGKEIRVWHQPKNSKERKLLFDLRNWDYNWQSSYYTKEYYQLKKETPFMSKASLIIQTETPLIHSTRRAWYSLAKMMKTKWDMSRYLL